MLQDESKEDLTFLPLLLPKIYMYMKKELTLVNIYAIGGDFLESVIDGFQCIIKIKKKMLKKKLKNKEKY